MLVLSNKCSAIVKWPADFIFMSTCTKFWLLFTPTTVCPKSVHLFNFWIAESKNQLIKITFATENTEEILRRYFWTDHHAWITSPLYLMKCSTHASFIQQNGCFYCWFFCHMCGSVNSWLMFFSLSDLFSASLSHASIVREWWSHV